jgi:hypothetical protein
METNAIVRRGAAACNVVAAQLDRELADPKQARNCRSVPGRRHLEPPTHFYS